MGKVDLVRSPFNSPNKLENLRDNSQRNLAHVRSRINELKSRVLNREMTYSQYEWEMAVKHGDRSLGEWHDFYSDYLGKIARIEEKRRRAARKRKILSVILLLFFGAVIVFAAFNFAPRLVGYVILPESIENATQQAYVEKVGFSFSSSGEKVWNPLNKGQLNSAAFYGSYSGSSHFRIYLDDLLIVDSRKLISSQTPTQQRSKGSPITGFAIGIPEGESSGEESGIGIPENIENQTSPQTSTGQQNQTSPTSPASPPSDSNEGAPATQIPNGSSTDLPQQEPPSARPSEKPDEFEIKLTEACTDNCELTQFNLNKDSYMIRVKFENADEGAKGDQLTINNNQENQLTINNNQENQLIIDEVFYIVSVEEAGVSEEPGAEAPSEPGEVAPDMNISRLVGIQAGGINFTVNSPLNQSYGSSTTLFNITTDGTGIQCRLFLDSEIGNNNTDVYLGYTDNLQLAYHFNNASGENSTHVKDFSAKSNNATIMNASITPLKEGRIKGDIGFPGTTGPTAKHYMNTTSLVNVTNTSNSGFTISFWLNMTDTAYNGNLAQGIIRSDGWLSLGASEGFEIHETDVSAGVGNSYGIVYTVGKNNPSETYNSNTTINTSEWHNFVLKYNDTTIGKTWLYVDGINVYNGSSNAPNVTLNSNLLIGADFGFAQALNGSIDELAVWNTTLSDAQIKEIYEAQKGKTVTNIGPTEASMTNTTMQVRPHEAWFTCRDQNTAWDYNISSVIFSVVQSNAFINEPAEGNAYNSSFIHFNVTTDNSATVQYSVDNGVTNITMQSNGGKDFDAFYIDEISGGKTWVNTTGLVALYHLNNDSAFSENDTRVYDFSGRQNNGTAYNGVVMNTTGKIRGAGTFDGGNDRVNIGNITQKVYINNTVNTISFWAYPYNIPTADSYSVLISLADNALVTVWLYSDGDIDVGNPNNGLKNSRFDNNNVLAGIWTHVALVNKNSTGTELFINGASMGGNPSTMVWEPEMFMGVTLASYTNGGNVLNGSIDEVAIWNRSLSAAEISSLYNTQRNNYNLSDGLYNLSVYANDTTSNSPFGIKRVNFTLDTIQPTLNFTNPTSTNNTLQVSGSFNINITSNDINNHSVFLDFGSYTYLWMRFNNASDTSNFYGPGTIDTGTSFGNYTVRGGTRYFNGTSRILVPGISTDIGTQNHGANILDSYAVAFWIRGMTPTNNGTIIEKFNDSQQDFYPFSLKTYAGINWTNFSVSGPGANQSINSSNIFDDKWHYVVAMVNREVTPSSLEVYVDSVLVGNTTFSAGGMNNNHQVFIGNNNGANLSFKGYLDNIIIFGRGLSSAEINASFNANTTVTNQLYRNFTGVSGGTYYYTGYAQDSAGNINKTETRVITIDTTSPSITVNKPLNQTYSTSTIPFNFTTSETSVCYWSVDNGTSNASMQNNGGMDFTGNTSDGNIQEMTSLKGWFNTTGLVALYHLNNDSGYGENDTLFYDFSGKQINGTCLAGANKCPTLNTTTGKIKKSYTFDGSNDIIELTGLTAYNNISSHTYMAWIYRNADAGTYEWIINNGDATGGTSLIIGDTDKIAFFSQGGNDVAHAQTNIPLGSWTHVAAVYYGNTTVQFYLNGGSDGGGTAGLTWSATNSNPRIGAWTNGGYPLKASIDEVAIWNRSLSAAEITNIYGNQSATYLGDGGYNALAYCNDTAGNLRINNTRWFSVQGGAPRVTINRPQNKTYNSSSIPFNATTNVDSLCKATTTEGASNFTLNNNGGKDFDGEFTHSDGDYLARYYCNTTDTGDMNNTETVRFHVDTAYPQVTVNLPVNKTYNVSSIGLNVTTNEEAACSFTLDGGLNNVTMQKNGLKDFNYTNSSIGEGKYTTRFYCNDTSSNVNSTMVRGFAVDFFAPNITFAPPTPNNATTLQATAFFVNVSANDSQKEFEVLLDINRSLVGWWRFNNETGENQTFVRDWSTYGNNGTAYNGVIMNVSGKMGGAGTFDGGNDYVISGPSKATIVTTTNQTTIGMWFKPTGAQSTIGIFQWAGGLDNSVPWILFQRTNSTTVRWYLNGNYQITHTVNDGAWYHIVLTFNGTAWDSYLNGEAPLTYTGAIGGYDGSNIYLGNGYSGYFNGSIDDVQIYSRALTAVEVAALYNASNNPYYNNFTTLGNGTFNFNAYAQDLAGNINSTGWRTVSLDTLSPPQVTIISPLNQTYNTTFIQFNSSTNEAASCNYTLDGGLINVSMTANSSNTGFNYTNSSIADGDYTANYSCADFTGNFNRSMSVLFHKDSTRPRVVIYYPTNSSIDTSLVDFNISVAETYQDMCSFSIDSWATNYTMTKYNSTWYNYTYEGISDGDYNAKFFCNDTVNNINMTSNVSFNVNAVADTNITACGTLNQANTNYVLTKNVSSTGTCFTIAANNITLDGRGYWVKYATQSNNAYAVRGLQGNYNKLTLKNLIINQSDRTKDGDIAFYFINITNISIINNTVYTWGGNNVPVWITASAQDYVNINTLIENNTLIANTSAINIELGSQIIIRGNNLSARGSGFRGFGPTYTSTFLNLSNNIITGNSSSSLVDVFTLNSFIVRNNITSLSIGVTGLRLGGDNNTITYNKINSSGNAIDLFQFFNNTFSNNTIYTSSSYYQLFIEDSDDVNQTYLIDQNISNYSFRGKNKMFYFESTLFGKIDFSLNYNATSRGINGSGNNLSYELQILNNSALVNSTINPGLNRSANITFYHMSGFGLQNPKILWNGVQCPAGYCYNYTALTADTVVFNVSGAGLYNITEGNLAPRVTNISYIADQSITEGGRTNVEFYALVNDTNGYGDISSVLANFTNGSATRTDSSCEALNNIGIDTRNYSCTVDIWHFDTGSTWNVTVYATDAGGLAGQNKSNFTLGQTAAFVIQPNGTAGGTSFTFASINPGDTNKTPTNNPLTLNNTGNKPIASGDVRINATNLAGESNNNYALYAGNFTAGINTGGSPPVECGGTGSAWMSRSVFTAVTGAVLPTGNLSAGGGAGQEQLYVCLTRAGNEISQQAYSTTNQGAWTISIFAVLLTIARRKKLKNDRMIRALGLIYEELRDNYSEETAELATGMLKQIRARTRLNKLQVYELIAPRDRIKIPTSIFTKELGGLEALVKYLKENIGMSYSETARMLKRDERTIWNSYSKAREKQTTPIILDKVKIRIPIEIFKSNETTLRSVIIYLIAQGFNYAEISRMLNRDQRNIWTIANREDKNNRL